MKRLSVALIAVFLALPFFALGESASSMAVEELFTPVDVELAKPDGNEAREGLESLTPDKDQEVKQDTEVCNCIKDTTDPVTKVGSTCSNARQNAADAARALVPACDRENCPATTHWISTCSPNPAGAGFQATATATYYCEICRDIPCD